MGSKKYQHLKNTLHLAFCFMKNAKKTKEVKITYCNFNEKKNRTRWPPLNHSAGAPVEKVPFFRLGSGRGARGLPIAPKPEARGASES